MSLGQFGCLEVFHLFADEIIHELDFRRMAFVHARRVLVNDFEFDSSKELVEDWADFSFIEPSFMSECGFIAICGILLHFWSFICSRSCTSEKADN